MIAHRLIERRAQLRTARELLHRSDDSPATQQQTGARTRSADDLAQGQPLRVTEKDIARWQAALARRPSLLARLARDRGWRYHTMRELKLGLDRAGSRSQSATPTATYAACCDTNHSTPAGQKCSAYPAAA